MITTFQCGSDIKGGGSDDKDEEEEEDSVESVAFSHCLPLFATGTVNGAIEVWDIASQIRRNVINQDSGISKLLWGHDNSNLLFTAGLDGLVRIWDGRSGELNQVKSGHSDQVLDFALAANNSCLLTSSEDMTCRVFSLS